VTRILKLGSHPTDPAHIASASQALTDGHIVAIPTETVYGLAADAHNPDAMERLRTLKGRPPDKPFAHLVADTADMTRLAGQLPAVAARLAGKFMPGSITLVVPGADGQDVGLRMPDDAATLQLIRSCPKTLVATSANPSGQRPAATAEEVARYFPRGEPVLILDSGPCRIAAATTVVRVDESSWRILRDGALSKEEVTNAVRNTQILFVCTGNTCRSPMAEGLSKVLLAKALEVSPDDLQRLGYTLCSAGTSTTNGRPASQHAVSAAGERDADVATHRSRPVTAELLRESDMIYCLTRSHLRRVRGMASEITSRSELLDPDGGDIADPIGGDLDTYRKCLVKIEKCLDKRVSQWTDGRTKSS